MGVELVSKDGGHVGDMGVMWVGGEVLYIGAARVPGSITCNTYFETVKVLQVGRKSQFLFIQVNTLAFSPPSRPRV